MLKRFVKEATGGFSSSGEQTSRRKKPTKRRDASSEEDEEPRSARTNRDAASSRNSKRAPREETEDEAEDRRKPKRKEEDTPTEDEPAAARNSKANTTAATRRKKASRMKREPLLEYGVIGTVHSAMHGKKKKRARQELLELFASYDADDTGSVGVETFKKCIAKAGIKLKKSDDVASLVRCFVKPSGGRAEEDANESSDAKSKTKSQRVDYVAFIDFACNVRDSEKLSEVAEKLRGVVKAYDNKHDRATTVPYNIALDLKKLDKSKRGWVASDRFGDFMQDHERPTFRLTPKEVALLTERFEYEYDNGMLGFDYQQFAQWLQPMLHLDKKELHARVKLLVVAAQDVGGWELAEVFEAMDLDGGGDVGASELKQGLLDMGLPLTDAQIRCLVDEYDVDGDGKIQYEEFVSLFQAPKAKRRQQQESGDSDTERTNKRHRSKVRPNVRNTFSWAINKAFARKHAAQAGKQDSPQKARPRKHQSSSSSSDANQATKKKGMRKKDKSEESESFSESEKRRQKQATQKRSKVAEASSSSSETSETTSALRRRGKSPAKKTPARKKTLDVSSTESEGATKREARRRERAESKVRSRKRDESTDEPTSRAVRRRREKQKSDEDSNSENVARKPRKMSSMSNRSRRDSAVSRRNDREESISKSVQRLRSPGRRRSHSQGAKPQRRHPISPLRSSQKRRARDQKRSMLLDRHLDSESDARSDGSHSGLDVGQVRSLQQQPRRKQASKRTVDNQPLSGGEEGDHSGDNEWDDSDEGSKSDQNFDSQLIASLRRVFEFFDTDRTGTIDKRELGHVLRALGHEFSSKELAREMQRADLDKNGELDFYEFCRFVKRQLSQKAYILSKRREMEIRQAFQSLNTAKNGYLDQNEFEYLIYKLLQVELSVEEQDALLDFVENPSDGTIHEDEFIAFMKSLEPHHTNGNMSMKRQREMLRSVDAATRRACSAVKKLVRGAPVNLDNNVLMLLGVPTNFRPALTSADVCRELHENSIAHALSFPCPETIVAMAQDPLRVSGKKEASMLGLGRASASAADDEETKFMLKQAENWQAHAIVSLKRASGVPKPFDTREDDVIKRCVHVCLYQEQEHTKGRRRRQHTKPSDGTHHHRHASGGTIVGNVHEIPVYWKPQEEDVWEFSRKSTKEDKYKFLVRTNNVNDHIFVLVEFIVHLRMASDVPKRRKSKLKMRSWSREVRELTACWCKIPVRSLLARRVDIQRFQEKLWGGTVHAPIDIEQDEIMRRRTGWRAITNAFKKPTPPAMGIKSAPVESYPEEIQAYVRKMPPLIIAPFVSLPIVAEYMTMMQKSMWLRPQTISATLCEPVLKLLPQIVDDHEALSVFRRVFDTEMNSMKSQEDRQRKFQELVLRMWPSCIELHATIPPTILQEAKTASASTRRLSLLSPTASSVKMPLPATGSANEVPAEQQARFSLLQLTAQGKLRLRDVPVAAAPFHVREVTFDRLI